MTKAQEPPDPFKGIDPDKLEYQVKELTLLFDKFIWLEDSRIHSLAKSMADEVEDLEIMEGRKEKARSNQLQKKYEFSSYCILVNLLKARKTKHRPHIAINLDANEYSANKKGAQPLLSYKTLKVTCSGLTKLGYISKIKGFNTQYGDGKYTRIYPEYKLGQLLDEIFPEKHILFSQHHNAEQIILKAPSSTGEGIIDYQDTRYTKRARGEVITINERLSQHWYDINLNEEKLNELHNRIYKDFDPASDKKNSPSINFSARQLRRTFNNGFKGKHRKNFTEGGRFYGGWWMNIPSEYRPFITIDTKPTVEIDFSSMHPNMLYNIEGKELEGDAYSLDTNTRAEPLARDILKNLFQRLLNGSDEPKELDNYDSKVFKMEWSDLVNSFKSRHSNIARYFLTGYGIKLMKRESDIANNIMLDLVRTGHPILPIHDSFIVELSQKDLLQESMLKRYRKEMGFNIGIKTKGLTASELRGLSERPPALDYMTRHNVWDSCREDYN